MCKLATIIDNIDYGRAWTASNPMYVVYIIYATMDVQYSLYCLHVYNYHTSLLMASF